MDVFYNISVDQWMSNIFLAIYVVIIISCIYVILTENRNPIKSLAWVTVLIFMPIVGWIFYLFFGRSIKGLHLISIQKKRKLLNTHQSKHESFNGIDISDTNKQIIKLAHSLCGMPLYTNNDITIYNNGKDKFEQLKADLQNAKSSINIQYYIFNNDKLGTEIADILSKKAQEGIKVRVIYDHVGSFNVNNSFFKRLRQCGVDAQPFFRVTFPQLANRINWRNHRKIIIIDGEIGYIGGMNIADRYIDGPSPNKKWRDTHIRVTGNIVNSLQVSFATDWNFVRNDLIIDNTTASNKFSQEKNVMQLITSGPTSSWSNIALIFHKAIAGAKKSIYIQTPYFLPTEALMKALITAALSKVDVRIMIPRKSDSKMLKYASYSYINECLKAGIKIYLYDAGMLHSKNIIIDDDFYSTGSTNFDFRSFEHNFEANILIYSRQTNQIIKEQFFDDIKESSKITLSTWQKRPKSQSLLESLIRLFAPIL